VLSRDCGDRDGYLAMLAEVSAMFPLIPISGTFSLSSVGCTCSGKWQQLSLGSKDLSGLAIERIAIGPKDTSARVSRTSMCKFIRGGAPPSEGIQSPSIPAPPADHQDLESRIIRSLGILGVLYSRITLLKARPTASRSFFSLFRGPLVMEGEIPAPRGRVRRHLAGEQM
jgi:hypothetical protein